ncbi:MAG: hypothetical protein JOZ40_07580 [Methylobacteriaceae bacterium]|nr:hypothetical protein [Methylobacteriaceae bacterium]
MAQEAWDSGDPVVRDLLDGWAAADAIDAAREVPFHETATERAHAARPVTLDTLARVLRDDAIVAAIERSPARDRVLELLRVARPATPAALAEIDGTVSLRGATLVVTNAEYPDMPMEVAIAGRTVLVADGAGVAAGDHLTSGDRDLQEVVRVLGTRAAAGELIELIAPLVDLPRDRLEALVEPMFGHVALIETKLRVTTPTFESWLDVAPTRGYYLRADALITSYATLAAHVDPTLDAVIAAMQQLDEAPPVDRDAYRMQLKR